MFDRCSEDHRGPEHRRSDIRFVCWLAARHSTHHCTAGHLHKRCVWCRRRTREAMFFFACFVINRGRHPLIKSEATWTERKRLIFTADTQSNPSVPNLPLSSYLLQVTWGTPRCTQISPEIPCQYILGLPPELLPLGHTQKTSPGSSRQPNQIPEPPFPTPLNAEEQQLHSEPPPPND